MKVKLFPEKYARAFEAINHQEAIVFKKIVFKRMSFLVKRNLLHTIIFLRGIYLKKVTIEQWQLQKDKSFTPCEPAAIPSEIEALLIGMN
jgi:hypothetical protein